LGGRKCDFAVVVVDLVWFSLFSFLFYARVGFGFGVWVEVALVIRSVLCSDHEIVLVVFQ
jgi:hypothetical protein